MHPRKLCLSLAVLVVPVAPALAAEDPQPATRPAVRDSEVQAAVRAYDAAEAKARAEYERAVAAARAEMVRKLQARLDALTKAGRLDDAVAVRDLIASARPRPAARAAPAAANTPPAVTPFVPVAEAVGVRAEGNGTQLVLRPDGRFVYAGDQPGTWKLTAEALVLTWAKGRVDTYTTRDGDTITGDSTIGHNVTVRKVR